MNATVIDPGATLGVLGGGQLGAMFATAARRLGYAVVVWDPDPEAPAHRLADSSLIRPFTDSAARQDFIRRVCAVTYEWENVPADLCEQLERDVPVRPSSRVLRVIQDRIEQKTFLRTHGLPVPAFHAISSPQELRRQTVLEHPLVCKTATAGYDGKGQWKIARAED
ncbi:MAG TPA: ATP-grasp domain-containing protein, partial [Nitrospira sp.]|nr:ATP-grasp domain-containing protein [Nitrospira sp.]